MRKYEHLFDFPKKFSQIRDYTEALLSVRMSSCKIHLITNTFCESKPMEISPANSHSPLCKKMLKIRFESI